MIAHLLRYFRVEFTIQKSSLPISPTVLLKFVILSYPLFSKPLVISGDGVVMESLIKHVEPLLSKYRVNIGFYGHNHVVQRQSAVYNSKVIQKSIKILNDNGDIVNTFSNPQATVHMVIGTAGAGFTKNANDEDNRTKCFALTPSCSRALCSCLFKTFRLFVRLYCMKCNLFYCYNCCAFL